MKAAMDAGLRIPDDISFVGFGNFSVAEYVMPSLTTVKQDRVELGRKAAEAVLSLARGEAIQDHRVAIEVIKRDSVVTLKCKA